MNKPLFSISTCLKAARQRGLTLVELMVAMTLMGLVTVATISLYTVASQTSKTVDSSQELNDSARFAFEVIGQSLRTAGYQDYLPNNVDLPKLAGTIYPAICTNATLPCPIMGFNNAIVASPTSVSDFGATNNGSGSDTLGVTFFGSSKPSDPAAADGSMVDCLGDAKPTPLTASDLGLSLFWVTTPSGGEPELSCIGANRAGSSQPVVRGVESFQVMYAVDTAVAGTLTVSSVPSKWVSAQDVTDWNKVRAVRVGLVLRGAIGSSQAKNASGVVDYYPMGVDFTGSSTEVGLKFTPANPNDGRLRKAFAATFMLRNSL
jgi:type IV pilus assembly protein PilW